MRYVSFLIACLLWPFCGMIADINDMKGIGALSFFGMILAGIYVGLDLLLAPKTSLPFLVAEEFSSPWLSPLRTRLVGLMFIPGNITMALLQMRSWLGIVLLDSRLPVPVAW